jgi:hypothetical protein
VLITSNGLIETEAEIIVEHPANVPVDVNTELIEGLTLMVLVVAPVLHKYEFAPETVSIVFVPEQIVVEFTVKVGLGLIIIVDVPIDVPQELAATVYVTIYVPVELDAKLTNPEVALIFKPLEAEKKVPPDAKPLDREGIGFVPFEQYGFEYEKVVVGEMPEPTVMV